LHVLWIRSGQILPCFVPGLWPVCIFPPCPHIPSAHCFFLVGPQMPFTLLLCSDRQFPLACPRPQPCPQDTTEVWASSVLPSALQNSVITFTTLHGSP
jgi:hypothetical protein